MDPLKTKARETPTIYHQANTYDDQLTAAILERCSNARIEITGNIIDKRVIVTVPQDTNIDRKQLQKLADQTKDDKKSRCRQVPKKVQVEIQFVGKEKSAPKKHSETKSCFEKPHNTAQPNASPNPVRASGGSGLKVPQSSGSGVCLTAHGNSARAQSSSSHELSSISPESIPAAPIDKTKYELGLNKAIDEYTKAMNRIRHDAFDHGSERSKKMYNSNDWEMGGSREHDTEYLQLKPGKNPARAIRDVFAHPEKWNYDCALFLQIVELYAQIEAFGDDEFNRRITERASTEKNQKSKNRGTIILDEHYSTGTAFSAIYYYDSDTSRYYLQSPDDVRRGLDGVRSSVQKSKELLEQAPPGSRVAFNNRWHNPTLHEVAKALAKTSFDRENTVKLPDGRFAAHPFGVGTEEEIGKALAIEALVGVADIVLPDQKDLEAALVECGIDPSAKELTPHEREKFADHICRKPPFDCEGGLDDYVEQYIGVEQVELRESM